MRLARSVAWVALGLVALAGWCEARCVRPREVFFLHNRFFALQGAQGRHPEHGRVEYEEILATLRGAGFVVHAEQRAADADLEAVAERVAAQVRARLAAGVPASHLTVVGASEGGYVAMLVARRLRQPCVRYVLVGACVPEAWAAEPGGGLVGRILRIQEATDPITAGCRLLPRPLAPARGACDHTLELRTGLQHGFLYKALDDWLLPTIDWARGAADRPDRGTTTATEARLGAAIDAALDARRDPAFQGVVLVAEGGRTRVARCRGWGDPERTRPLVLRSAFPVGSISKQVTAVLTLQAVERGDLHLDDTVGDHLPELGSTPAGPVRLDQLLSHTHGLAARQGPAQFAPGTALAYGNVGYVLAGEVLGRRTQRRVEDLAAAEFQRLRLVDARGPSAPSVATDALGMRAGLDGSRRRSQGPADPPPPLAAGGFLLSAPDLVAWTAALHGGALLRPASCTALLETRGVLEHPAFGRGDYGLGLVTASTVLGRRIGHTGMTSGTSNVCVHYPERGLTVVVLCNLLPAEADAARAYAAHVAVVRAVEGALGPACGEGPSPGARGRPVREGAGATLR